MSKSYNYYYLKLKEDFFDRDEIIELESFPQGVNYLNVLIKMYLYSLKNDGRLVVNGKIPCTLNMLSHITNHSLETVEKAVELFHELKLIRTEDGILCFDDIEKGKSSTEADKKRERRRKIPKEQRTMDKSINNKRYGGNYYLVLERDNHTCRMCGNLEKLCVHHIDGYDDKLPQNNRINKLITLCRGCHGKVHGRGVIPTEILLDIKYFVDNEGKNE